MVAGGSDYEDSSTLPWFLLLAWRGVVVFTMAWLIEWLGGEKQVCLLDAIKTLSGHSGVLVLVCCGDLTFSVT